MVCRKASGSAFAVFVVLLAQASIIGVHGRVTPSGEGAAAALAGSGEHDRIEMLAAIKPWSSGQLHQGEQRAPQSQGAGECLKHAGSGSVRCFSCMCRLRPCVHDRELCAQDRRFSLPRRCIHLFSPSFPLSQIRLDQKKGAFTSAHMSCEWSMGLVQSRLLVLCAPFSLP